jgi:short subunit fatty acids transporter
METFLKFIEILLSGDMRAIVLILAAIIVALIWDRLKIMKQLADKDEKVEKILAEYHKGNMTLAEALNNVRMVLYEIKGKL